MELIGDLFGDLALNGEDVSQIAIVYLCPKMRVCPGVNQLCVYAHTVAGALHAAFEHMRNAEFLGDLAKVAHRGILILHHTCATNYFQVGNSGEIRKDFVLNAVCEVGVLFFIAKIFKGKNGDAFSIAAFSAGESLAWS